MSLAADLHNIAAEVEKLEGKIAQDKPVHQMLSDVLPVVNSLSPEVGSVLTLVVREVERLETAQAQTTQAQTLPTQTTLPPNLGA